MTNSALLLTLVLAAPADAVPTVRPRHFTGAIGQPITAFGGRVTATPSAPPEVRAGTWLTLTLTVRGAVNAGEVAAPDLAALPAFAADFDIRPTPTESAPAGEAVFTWRLRPKGEKVAEVPTIPFVYFRPGCLPASAGFMTTDSGPALPLRVLPADADGLAVPLTGPDWLFELSPVAAPWWLSRRGEWALALGGSLLVGALGGIWRLLRPDAARRRRTRAGRKALAALSTATDAGACRRAVRDYLADRHGLPTTAMTPAEIAAALGSADVGGSALLEWYDAVRFGPGEPPALAELQQRGTAFVTGRE